MISAENRCQGEHRANKVLILNTRRWTELGSRMLSLKLHLVNPFLVLVLFSLYMTSKLLQFANNNISHRLFMDKI